MNFDQRPKTSAESIRYPASPNGSGKPHICIVTTGQLGTNPRVVKEAGALIEAGYLVTVVCSKLVEVVEPRDQSLLAEAVFNVRRIRFDRRFRWKMRRLIQLMCRVLFRFGWRRWPTEHAVGAMVGGLKSEAASIKADLYIAHYSAALPAAAHAAKKHGTLYAFDAEDFHRGEFAARASIDVRLVAWIEDKLLPGAVYVTAASPMIAEAYARHYPRVRPTAVLNVFPRAGAPGAPSARGLATPGPSVYWFSQVIGSGRGIETLIEAVAISAARPHVHLRGTPQGDYVSALSTLAAERGVADRLHLLDPIAPAMLERDAARFDIGYSGEPGFSENNRMALGNKIFSYLSSGLPIVASDVPAHRAIAPELDGAMVLFPADDPVALAAAIDGLLLDPARLAAARRRAWELGQGRFSWEEERGVLIGVVGKALRGTS